MIAAFVKKKHKVELREMPAPEPEKGQVVVRVDACGVCGSDYIMAEHWAKQWQRFGHEVFGAICEIGNGVTGFKTGDRVVLALSAPCGGCLACRKNMPRYCSRIITAEQGGFAEYLLVGKTELLRPIDASIPPGVAFMAEPLTVILEAFQLARLDETDTLFIAGGGFLGSLAALTAHLLGIPIAGVLSKRLDDNILWLQDMIGFTTIKWPNAAGVTAPPHPQIQAALSGHAGRTVVLHTAPAKTIADYLDALPYAATVVNIGLSAKAKSNRLEFDAGKMVFRRTQLLSAFPVPCLYFDDAVSLLERFPDQFAGLRLRAISLDELPQVIANRANGTKHFVSRKDGLSKNTGPYS